MSFRRLCALILIKSILLAAPAEATGGYVLYCTTQNDFDVAIRSEVDENGVAIYKASIFSTHMGLKVAEYQVLVPDPTSCEPQSIVDVETQGQHFNLRLQLCGDHSQGHWKGDVGRWQVDENVTCQVTAAQPAEVSKP